MMNQNLPLAMVSVGERVRLESIRGGEKLNRRLAAMGLTPGAEISIVQDNGGALLISVRNSRIALGRGMAHKVMVEMIDIKDREGVQSESTHTGDAASRRAGRQSKRRKKHHIQRAHRFPATRR